MISMCKESGCRIIENNQLSISFSETAVLKLADIRHRHTKTSWLTQCDIFQLKINDRAISSSDFSLTKTDTISDTSGEYLIYELVWDGDYKLISRVSVSTDEDQGLIFLIQIGADWKELCPQEIFIHVPLFKHFGQEGNQWYLSTNPVSKPDGYSAIQTHGSFDLPICNIAHDQKAGFSFEMRNIDQFGGGWNQLRNCDLLGMGTKEQLWNNNIWIRQQNKEPADIFEFKIYALDQGWSEAFCRWKNRIRRQMDLSMYSRPDLQWNRKNFYQQLSFAYSKEIFDYEKQTFIPDELIDTGKEFGGFDSIILWFVYPRLGVDERSQWEFNDDIPGGIDGIRDFVHRCHNKGVKVFLPYNPWDEKVNVSPLQTADMLCDLIQQTEIDGIWLDTMDRMPDDFRKRVDKIRPGVVFNLECYPATNHMVELITGHWDQIWGRNIMPQSNILRFLFPENNAPIAARWLIGEAKDILIKRAIFNGAGLAIWQDIFGAWLPFSAEQKATLKKWKTILLEHFDAFSGIGCIPMVPMLQEKLYANKFIADDGSEVIYTVYNASEQTVDGALMEVPEIGEAKELWMNIPIQNRDGFINGSIGSNEVMIVSIKP